MNGRPAATALPAPFESGPEGLTLHGRPVAELAERFGTPLYVTSEQRLRENVRRLRAAFEPRWPVYRVLYAVKANSNPAIVRVLREAGCGADCSSPSEIRIAREAGVPASEMLYTAAFPSDEELGGALDRGLAINLDDPGLVERLFRLGTPSRLSFRLNPGATDAGPEGLRFSGRQSKFGTPLGPALRGYRWARRQGLRRFGLHTMPGSNILRSEHFGHVGRFLGDAARRIASATGVAPEFADAGGGLGVPYRPQERPLDLDRTADRLAQGLIRGGSPAGAFELWNEPGRLLVADSTVLLTRVTHVKPGPPRFVGVDAGMHTLLRPALYGAYHEVYSVTAPRPGGFRKAIVTGPICENTDVLARDRRLPELQRGDLLALGTAGAYGFAMASQYNTRPRPAEILVTPREPRLIRRRETFDDLMIGIPNPSAVGRRR
ncbi:MAG: diaminopimelate decarboxylase [Thermoplasmata archaeon]